GHIGTLERRINRMESLLAAVDGPSASGNEADNQSSSGQSIESSTASTAYSSYEPAEQQMLSSITNVARQNNLRAKKIPEEDLDLARFESVRFLGDVSGIKFLSKSLGIDRPLQQYLPGHQVERLGKDTFLCAVEKMPNQEIGEEKDKYETRSEWTKHYVGLQVEACDRLLSLYFMNIHPIFPIVNKHTFLERYRGLSKSYPSTIVFNAMLGAAARYFEISNDDSLLISTNGRALSDILFDRVLKEVFLQSVSGPSLPMVQAIILLINHHARMDSKGSDCYLLIGIAIRMAQDLGLHQSCDDWNMPEMEKQTRKRIWWSLYVMDRFNSALFGKPLTIVEEDCDVDLPKETAPWIEIVDGFPKRTTDPRNFATFPSIPDAQSQQYGMNEERPLYQMFLQLTKLSQIIGHILQGLYTTRAKQQSYIQGSDNIVTRLDHELTIWRFGLIKVLQENDQSPASEVNVTPVAASIHLCYYAALLLLHRPFIEHIKQGRPNPLSSYSSFRICTSAAERAIILASNLSPSDFLRFSWSFNLSSVFQGGLMCIYNSKNVDARVSTRAKSHLAQCIVLLKRIKSMSESALRIDRLIHIMMKLQEVDMTGYRQQIEAMGVEEEDERKKAEKTVRSMMQPIPTNDFRTRLIDSQSPPVARPIEIPPTDIAKPSTMVDNSLPMAVPNFGEVGPTAEAFSLKQFGLSKENEFSYMKALDSITGDKDIWSADNSVNNTNQQLQNPPVQWSPPQQTELATNTLFQTGYLMGGIPTRQDPYAQPFPTILTATVPNNPAVAAAENTLFRNTPSNPFWSIPASFDWDEWNSYYDQAAPAVEGTSGSGVW
ncbi:hypothetical protein INT44_000603, partial [Umbelopsis vinacea]